MRSGHKIIKVVIPSLSKDNLLQLFHNEGLRQAQTNNGGIFNIIALMLRRPK
ncbi:RepB family protein [Pedobacter zeae]|uniref:RepB family protein n=1 Tax=Pedobacter zeae TaxID=1737356 RepID=UPI001611282A